MSHLLPEDLVSHLLPEDLVSHILVRCKIGYILTCFTRRAQDSNQWMIPAID